MKDVFQKLPFILSGFGILLLWLLVSCAADEPAQGNTVRPISTVSDLFGVQPTKTPAPTPTARPPVDIVVAVPQTATSTISETVSAITPTVPPAQTTLPNMVIYDELLHPDWSLEGSTVNFDLTYRGEAFRGVYALEVERILSDDPFFPILEMNLLPEAARSFPLAEIDNVSLWIYSGNGSLGVRDLSLGVVLSTEPFPSDSATLNVIELDLAMFGLEEAIEPDTWVQLRYSPQELAIDESFAYLTGLYIENNVGFTQTILVDAVEIQFLAVEEVWQSAELVAITP